MYSDHITIKAWAEEDRPREKMMLKGKHSLSEAELMAILIGSGSRNETAVQVCQKILHQVDNNLNELGKLTFNDLIKFKGIGEAKAITIVAALELGRRRQLSDVKQKLQIKDSNNIYTLLSPNLADLPHEEFWVIYLNRSNKVLLKERLSIGGISGTVADSKIIFKKAIDLLASSFIVAHNHPSGNLKPSQADIDLTKNLKAAGKLLEINLLDHLIITDSGYYSFADEGVI